jgi:predicted TIM-barrel fold metal-dependent hydrolase
MKIISADSHFNEPIDFYSSLQKKFGSFIPRIESFDDGDYWVAGEFKRPLGVMNRPGQRGRGNTLNLKYEDTEWFTDLKARKINVEKDGVGAEVLFPSGAMLYTIPDVLAREACMIHLNEFMADLKGFYQGVLMLPDEPEAAFKMLKRFGGSSNAFLLPLYTGAEPYFGPSWNKVFELMEETNSIVAFHAGTLDPNLRLLPNHEIAKSQTFKTSRLFFQAHHLLMELIFGGVLIRFPSLKVVISELGASWVPYSVHRMMEGNSIYEEFDLSSEKITEIVRENFLFTVQFDFPQSLGAVNSEIHAGNILFGSDFPHVESTYGRTRDVGISIQKIYGVDDAKMVLNENSLRTFNKLEVSNA